MRRHTQYWPWHREAGGQLFGTVSNFTITVEEATPPRPGDVRRKNLFEIDKTAADAELADRQSKGLFYFGDWHTHPEHRAKPSGQDLNNAGKLIRGARSYPFLIMVIVGVDSTFVAIYNSRSLLELERMRPLRRRFF